MPVHRTRRDGYQKKLSGPLLDRIDLQVELERLSLDEHFAETETGVSAKVRVMVDAARQRQEERFKGTGIPFNAAIPGGEVREYCDFASSGLMPTSTSSKRATCRRGRWTAWLKSGERSPT